LTYLYDGDGQDVATWKLAVDAAGNCVVQGTYNSGFTLGGDTAPFPASVGAKGPFFVRITAAGILAGAWAGKQTRGDNNLREYTGVALAPTGEVYLSGYLYRGTMKFGDLPPVISPETAATFTGFLLKVSAANIPEWVLVGRNTSGNACYDVKVGLDGRIYTLGYTAGTLQLEGTSGSQEIVNPANDNTYLARISPGGRILRSLTGATSGNLRLALGLHDDLYIQADRGESKWGSVQFSAPVTDQQRVGVSVVRLDSTGRALQGWQAIGLSILDRMKMAVDGQGRVAVAGTVHGASMFTFGTHATSTAAPNGIIVARTGAAVLANRATQAVAGLALYPNPARQTVTIQLASAAPAQAQVLDALGRVAATQALPRDGQLRLNGLAPGPYIVRVQQGEAVSYRHLTVLP
jgi:hypothetical protein